MTENIENIIKLDTNSFIEMCQKIDDLTEENKRLEDELTHFKARNFSLSKRCRELTIENHDLALEIKDMKFTKKYLTSEEAGKRFAQELLGGI